MNNRTLTWGLAALVSALSGCLLDKQSNHGTVLDRESRVGRLFLADGSPAVSARVRVYPVDHVPDTSANDAYSTRTDATGRYQLDSLPSGEYNILGELDELSSYQDSVALRGGTGAIPNDTLDRPASLTGVVALQPQDSPISAVVQVMGTNNYANVNENGRFKLDHLAGGRYTLRVVVIALEYTPLFTSFRIATGTKDTLADTLRPNYTGVPVVLGLKAVYDTAAGLARLSWNAVSYRDFSDYLVFRDLAPGLSLSQTPLATVGDTLFTDSLASGRAGLFGTGGPASIALEYRVRVRSKTDKVGLAFGKAALAAVHPDSVKTFFNIKVLGSRADSGRAGDTVRIRATFRNPTRTLKSIAWFADAGNPAVRSVPFSAGSGSDTLRYLWKDSSAHLVRVEATDDAGARWSDSLRVRIVADAPVALASGDTLVPVNGTIRLRASASQRFGSIRKWEWDIGGRERYVEAKDTAVTAPSAPDSAYRCVLRVTSDIGQMAMDTLRVRIVPWARKAPASFADHGPFGYASVGFSRAVVAGKVYVFRETSGRVQAFEYDPVLDRWTGKAMTPDVGVEARGYFVQVIEGIVYLPNPENLFAYDPLTDHWAVKAPPPTARTYNSEIGIPSTVVGGKLYLLGGKALGGREGVATAAMDVYDPATDAWKEAAELPLPNIPDRPDFPGSYGFHPVDGKLLLYFDAYYFGGTDRLASWLYDPPSDTWAAGDSALKNIMTGAWKSNAASVPETSDSLAGRIYASDGGLVYDIGTGKWSKTGYPAGHLPAVNSMMVRDGKLYFFFTSPAAEIPGESPRGPWSTYISVFDPITAEWKSLQPMLSEGAGVSVVPVGSRLFLMTWTNDGSPTQVFEYFLP